MAVIQWFPGHMAKAKREIEALMKQVDLVLELKDARIPYSSTNPLVDEICKNKPRLVLLNKAGIADKAVTKKWIDYYKENNLLALDIDSMTGYNINKIVQYSKMALKETFEKRKAKGIISTHIKAMILGIPNVGKSTLINRLAKRKAVNVGDKPGVTKNQTWIKVNEDLVLLDTPGILWPKFEDQMVGVNLSLCGSIKDEIVVLEDVCKYGLEYIKNNYPNKLIERYKLDDLNEDEMDLIDKISQKRGYLLKGGLFDRERAVSIILNEIRDNKIGEMSYEVPKGIDQSI